MFIQLPIFIGLYRALSVDIELRQAAVSSSTDWASNLAAPDMCLFWGDWLWDYFSGRGTGWLGPYFNLLPVVVVVLFLTQQKNVHASRNGRTNCNDAKDDEHHDTHDGTFLFPRSGRSMHLLHHK
jgi:membrane protein insertase Oxa1/YidC/SpoIIIJ